MLEALNINTPPGFAKPPSAFGGWITYRKAKGLPLAFFD
jgi:hypothetical protein